MFVHEGLKEFATERQREYIDAVNKHGSMRAAARALGVNYSSVNSAITNAKKRAAQRGFSPEHDMTKTTADGYGIAGTSTLYDADGNQVLQWVKTKQDAEEQRIIERELLSAFLEEIPRAEPIAFTDKTSKNLLNCFILTDYHIGMNAWGEETGADWDLKIAEELLVNWFNAAIKESPNADTAILAQLGDFLHWDDARKSITPEHGNFLDGDTRTQKMIRVAIRVLRRIINMLLKSHQHVHIIMAEGNHDPASSMWLREVFNVFYEDEPRATVDLSPDPYYCYQHGNTSLFFHHGHKRGIKNIETVFAGKFRPIIGETKHSYAHMGHLHDEASVEGNLMLITRHRTLSSPDSYATRGGWVSGRSAERFTYHSENGRVGYSSITPEMVS